MLLYELLDVLDESVPITVYDAENSARLGVWDGCRCIDPALNLADVAVIVRGVYNSMALEDMLDVYVYTDTGAARGVTAWME